VQEWLADHPRWVFHFTPKSASWIRCGARHVAGDELDAGLHQAGDEVDVA